MNQNVAPINQKEDGGGVESNKKVEESTGATASVMKRKSIFEHIESNMTSAESKTFIYRMTVVGSHEVTPENLMKFTDRLINDINAGCYDEPATGFLAVYPNYFLQLIEGSEDTLNKYIQACANEFQDSDPVPVPEAEDEIIISDITKNHFRVGMKILSYVRVFARSIEKWTSLIWKEEGEVDLLPIVHGFRNRLYEFVKKVWILSTVLVPFTQPEEVTIVQNVLEFEDPADQLLVQEAAKDLQNDLEQELKKYFPTTEMLAYFMKRKQRLPPLRTPKEHMEHFWNMPKVIFDSETVWPIPCRLARYD